MQNKNFTLRITVLILIFLIIPVTFSIVSVPSTIKLLVSAVCFLFIMYSVFVLLLFYKVKNQDKTFIQSHGENILIIAPHQDDCVALAGGYAVQTVEKGGQVNILYTTDGYKDDKFTRKQEAIKAWSVLGDNSVSIEFLSYTNNQSFLSRYEIDEGINKIGEYLKKVKPETIFIPLYEGGHYQHDVTNYMVSKALDNQKLPCTVYESPIYNFFMSFNTTPEKILSGLVRFIPFVSYDYPPEPVRNDTVYYLKMTDEQLQKKKEIIVQFKTQSPHKLVERWGFCDRYQKLHDYDYSQPPFDYSRSLACRIHRMKSWPLIGNIMRKVMIWTVTIHPDPDYTMTKIPFV